MNDEMIEAKLNQIVSILQQERADIERIILRTRILESEIRELQGKGRTEIVTSGRFENRIRWCLDRNAVDNVTEYIRGGYLGADPDYDHIDEQFWDLFPTPGTFLDIGAHVGAFALPFASFGWGGIAVEASRKNARLLRRSIRKNHYNIKVINRAVWSETGMLHYLDAGPQGMIQKDVENDIEKTERIKAIRLDDYQLLPEFRTIGKIDLVKMDIEGSEVAALRGAHKFLEEMKYPPMYIEANIWCLFCMDESPKTLFREAMQIGYHPYMLYHSTLLQYDPACFPLNPCCDYLFIHESDETFTRKISGEWRKDPAKEQEYITARMTDFNNWLADFGTDVKEVLAHIAMFAMMPEYPEYREVKEIYHLMYSIAERAGKLEDSTYQKMIRKGLGNRMEGDINEKGDRNNT